MRRARLVMGGLSLTTRATDLPSRLDESLKWRGVPQGLEIGVLVSMQADAGALGERPAKKVHRLLALSELRGYAGGPVCVHSELIRNVAGKQRLLDVEGLPAISHPGSDHCKATLMVDIVWLG